MEQQTVSIAKAGIKKNNFLRKYSYQSCALGRNVKNLLEIASFMQVKISAVGKYQQIKLCCVKS